VVEASWATGVGATGATLWATIDANGSKTEYHFEYITQAAYEANLSASREGFFGASRTVDTGAGSGAVPESHFQQVQSLKPTNTYVYRAVAKNAIDSSPPGPEHRLTTTATTATFALPDGRGWEMVSPVDKNGGGIGAPEGLFGGGDFQAAEGGGAVTYSSGSSFGPTAGIPPVSQYVSRRSGSGWATENVSAPLESGGYAAEPDGAPYRVFSSDLSRGLTLDGTRCAVEETCPPSYSLWQGGSWQELPTVPGLAFAGATPDLSHAVFEGEGGLYEWNGGLSLTQLSSDPGATLAAPIGAISEGGTRVYFNAGGDLYLWNGGAPPVQVDEAAGGGGEFQAASAGGAVAFFTASGSLYRFELGAGAGGPIATGVTGVLGATPDGSQVYFQDGAGLKLWHSGTTTPVASGANAAQESDFPPATGTARVSSDGTLAFLSKAELTGYDNLDAGTKEPDSELFLYRPAKGGLICVSCNPTKERPEGPSTIPGAPANGSTRAYKPRALSENGNRLIFDSADGLFMLDTNKRPDVYEWEAFGEGDCASAPGCVRLLSDGRSSLGFSFVDASGDGEDAYFLTEASLVKSDPGSIDIYDARIGGGFPEPEGKQICVGDACPALPSEPEDPTPGTLVPTSGNPAPRYIKEKPKHRKGKRRHHRRHRHHHRRHRAKRARSGR